MSEYQKLSDAGRAEIVSEYMSALLEITQAVDVPQIALVAAQPGAGKSKAADIVKEEFASKGGHIHVDADIMRQKIPVPPGVVYSSQQTQEDAGKLAVGVRKSALENSRNVLEEGTFRNAEAVCMSIKAAREAGLKIEMLAVATAPEESLAGIFKRYEDQYLTKNIQPRFVDEDFHNKAFEGFKNTVATHEAEFDRIRVTNRPGEILYDSLNKQQNKQASAKDAMEFYQQIPPERLKQVAQVWDVIQLQADRRSQDPVPNYFDKVKQHREEIYQRVEEIYRQERVVANSEGATLQRKSGDTWHDLEKVQAKGMKAGIHMLGTAKPAESGKEYSGEIVHKDEASVFQKTDQGLIRHKAVQGMAGGKFSSLSEQVEIGQKVSIKRDGNGLSVKAADASLKKMMKR